MKLKHEPLNNSRTCAVCNKEFIIHPGAGWLYKKIIKGKTVWFCSWTCQRKAEQKGTK